MTRAAIVAYALIGAASLAACHKSAPPETSAAPAPTAAPAPAPEAPPPAAPSPAASLTDMLGSQLGLSPSQANGGVGSILSYAQGKLPPADFDKVAATIPGGADLAKAAGPISDKPALNAAFNKYGITPYLAQKLIPTVTQYVGQVGGTQVGDMLGGVFNQ